MKLLRKYGCEILTLLSFCSFLSFVCLKHENAKSRMLWGVLVVLDSILLCVLIRKLWRAKWKKTVDISLQIILARIANAIARIFERWSSLTNKNQNLLSGKSSITFTPSLRTPDIKNLERAVAWKKLDSDFKRLGYLYRRMITEKINSGAEIKGSDTPCEIRDKVPIDEIEKELMDMYIDCRYDERKTIDSKRLLEMKKNFR